MHATRPVAGMALLLLGVGFSACQNSPSSPEASTPLPDVDDRFTEVVLPSPPEEPSSSADDNTARVQEDRSSPSDSPEPGSEQQRQEAQRQATVLQMLGTRGELASAGEGARLQGLGMQGMGRGGSGYGAGGGTFGSVGIIGAPSPSSPYTHYGINNTTLVSEDRMSTFSVDVDTASYTLVRSQIRHGQLPDPAAVRVEEFVNYFDYGYTPPQDPDTPFSVFMEAAPSPWESGTHIFRVGLQGRALDEDSRPPARLTFLVDVSGSMSSSQKLPLAQRAMRELVSNLGPEDSVAIATYAGRTAQILPPTRATDQEVILAAIEALQSGGGTAMSSGIDLAYEMASAAYVDGAENRVVILSDGDANIGPASHTQLLTQIQTYADQGITLSTIGFGMGNYQDTLMEQLANQGDGNNFYVDSFSEARRIFGEDLSGTMQTIAKDVKIQVEFDPSAVHAYRLIGYENRDIADQDFRDDQVDAGEVGSGHQVTALYELVLTDGYRDASTLATVRLRAKPPGPDAPAEEWDTVFPAEDVKYEMADTTADFRLALGVASFAEKLRQSPHTEELTHQQIEQLLQGTTGETEITQLIEQLPSLQSVPRSVSSTVSINMADVSDEVRHHIRRYQNQIRYCHERRLREEPTISGTLAVNIHVSSGQVTHTEIGESSIGDSAIENCVTRRMQRWQFPSEVSGDIHVPLTLAIN